MIVAAAGAIASGIASVGSAVADLFGFATNKDPQRYAANAQAFAAANAGDGTALRFLFNRSGRNGPGLFPADAYSGGVAYGPWATQVTKDDAFAKYQSASGRVPVPGTTPPPVGGTPSVPPVPGAGVAASLGVPEWLPLVAVAGAAAFFVFPRR